MGYELLVPPSTGTEEINEKQRERILLLVVRGFETAFEIKRTKLIPSSVKESFA